MSDCAIPDSIWPDAIKRRFSTEPCVACVTATRPGTPQLPPCSQGGEPAGFEIALAITAPISKKVPEVAAAPMRKNCPSCAPSGPTPTRSPRTIIAAAPGPHHQTPNLAGIVSPVRQQFGKTTWIVPDCNRALAAHHRCTPGDQRDNGGAVTFELAAPHPRNLGQRRKRVGAPASDLGQGRIVKNHVGRQLLSSRFLEPPRAQRLPQGACCGIQFRSGSLRLARKPGLLPLVAPLLD